MFLTLDERYLDYFMYFVRLHCCQYASADHLEQEMAIYEAKFEMGDPDTDLSED